MYDILNYVTIGGIELAIACMCVWLTKQVTIAIKYLIKMYLALEKKVEEVNSKDIN